MRNKALTLVLVLASLLVLAGLFFALRPSPAAAPSEKTFDLMIEEGAMVPGEINVDKGDQVKLRMTSDSPVGFHLHGYDLEEEIEPGEPAELAFDATITGRFEIEAERTQEELGTLVVLPG